MLLYKRYLLKKVTGYFFVISIILVCLIWFTRAVSFVSYITEKGVGISAFLYIFVLILPWLSLLIIPISLFISVLTSYNRMISSNEITILKSSGLNKMSISTPAINISIIVTLLCYLISFYLMPLANKNLRLAKKDFQHNYTNILITPGIFESLNNITIYVKDRYKNNHLSGILLFNNYDKENAITLTAQDGDLVEDNGSILMRLKNGTLQKYNHKERTSQILNFDSYVVNLSENPEDKIEYVWKASERYINELIHPENNKNITKEELKSFQVEIHQRITYPLFSLVLVLIACAFVLKGEFSRRGNYFNNFEAVIAASAFIGITMASYSLMEKNISFVYLLYANIIIFSILPIYLLRNSK